MFPVPAVCIVPEPYPYRKQYAGIIIVSEEPPWFATHKGDSFIYSFSIVKPVIFF